MYYIVANPVAEKGQTMFHLPVLTSFFDNADIPYITHITSASRDGYEKVLGFCSRHPECKGIIAIGGDGIVQEVVEGMADAFPNCKEGEKIPVPLGILPSKIGSDFSFTLEGSRKKARHKYKKDMSEICRELFEDIQKNCVTATDIVTANGKAFLNIGHLGFDSHIVRECEEIKHRFELDDKLYTVAAYKCIVNHKNIPLTIEIPGTEKYESMFTQVVMANGQYYGGGMLIAPHASTYDGKITVLISRALSRPRFVAAFFYMLMGWHKRLKSVSFVDCTEINITAPPDELLCLDGNLYPQPGEVNFRVLPGVLDIFKRKV